MRYYITFLGQSPLTPRGIVRFKLALKRNFRRKLRRRMQFGKYAVRVPSKIKAQRALET
jgi:hypothetical protein